MPSKTQLPIQRVLRSWGTTVPPTDCEDIQQCELQPVQAMPSVGWELGVRPSGFVYFQKLAPPVNNYNIFWLQPLTPGGMVIDTIIPTEGAPIGNATRGLAFQNYDASTVSLTFQTGNFGGAQFEEIPPALDIPAAVDRWTVRFDEGSTLGVPSVPWIWFRGGGGIVGEFHPNWYVPPGQMLRMQATEDNVATSFNVFYTLLPFPSAEPPQYR